jgi:hypothetical protein
MSKMRSILWTKTHNGENEPNVPVTHCTGGISFAAGLKSGKKKLTEKYTMGKHCPYEVVGNSLYKGLALIYAY